MKIKIALLLAVLAAFFVMGGMAEANTFVMTAQVPTFAGGSGTGIWSAHYKLVVTGSQQFQIEVKSYIKCNDTDCGANRSISGYDGPGTVSDVTLAGDSTYFFGAEVYGFVAPTCPFPGFHDFYNLPDWRSRQWVSSLGQWTAWTSFVNAVPNPIVNAQVCL
jgi:hypothetical protein